MRRFKVFTARSALFFILLLVIVNIFVSLYTVHRQDLLHNWGIRQDIVRIEAFRPIHHHTIQPYIYSSPIIQKQGCVITVILMEPNFNKAVFASLESVAAFVYPTERTCILIQTSICQYQTNDTVTSESAYQHVIELIHKEAGPIFKDIIHMGNVRVTILDHVKYQLQKCDYFYSPSNPWLNYYYWNDYKRDKNIEDGGSTYVRSSTGEFVPGQDSDFVLTIQKDAVLCTGLDVLAWREYSFVGAPWPPLPTWWSCTQLPANWITWHSTGYEIPPYPSETDFCTNPNIGPIGNGGLSLRSRYWMQQAIDYCPDADLSGLMNVSTTRTCYTTNTGNEDIYFATIFRGLIHNAHNESFTWNNRTRTTIDSTTTAPSPLKLPSVLQAAFFATETQWLRDVVKHYDIPSGEVDAMVQKMAWWDGKYNRKYMPSSNFKTKEEDGRVRFQRLKSIEDESLGKKPFLPIGIHKLWNHAGKNLWGEKENLNHFIKECPYLKDIIPKDYYS